MSLTISQLRVFTAVAEHGSIRAASRALGTAQSGITQQLQNLELMLGATLFTRTNRGVALTALGQRLLQRAGAILGECGRAEQEVQQLRGEYAGEVSFGMTTEPLIDALAPVLTEFRSRFERVSVHLRTGTSRMMIAWIRDGTLDFAVALVSKDTDTTDLSVMTLYPSDPVVVCRRGHPKAGAKSLEELADCTWIATRSPNLTGDTSSNRLLSFFEGHGLPPPRIIATVEGLFEALHLVGETDCLSLESSIVTQRGPFAGALKSIPLRERPTQHNVCLLQRAAIPVTPAAQELATMIASYTRTVRARAG
ncbi:LysR family transcriptional regulator of abg operon [Paraburkholderia sp. GAS448]|uniref:LysR substrate-binding domain-containing protein n=1 Tax=Paraburkholderia sp. GAS448 TaxID=3035136 RepID=UPI003D237A53